MNDHYNGADPARGCGLGVMLGLLVELALALILGFAGGWPAVLALFGVQFLVVLSLGIVLSYLGMTAGRAGR